LRFEPLDAHNEPRLHRVVEQSYHGTRDCPTLNGVQPIADVLEGYRATGEHRPEHWLLVCHGEDDVGCLLLADHPRHENLELVYMGVLPDWRGRGWGLEIVRHAQRIARRLKRERLVLAVDAENRPALAMYASAGLRAWERREVYYCLFDAPGTNR
jgi:hypothetical protein